MISVKISHKVEGTTSADHRLVLTAELTRGSVVHLLTATATRRQDDRELSTDEALDDVIGRLMMQVIETVVPVTNDPIKLVPTLPIAEETRQQAVAYLEQALEMAKSGDFDAACIILFRPDGGWHYDTTGMPSTTRIIGAIEIIKHGLIVAANV